MGKTSLFMQKWKQYKIKLPVGAGENDKISKTKAGLVFCKKCDCVFYKKSWHRNLRNYKNLKENLPVNHSLCPACRMLKNKQFEGEIIIKNAPLKIVNDLKHLTESFCKKAFKRDPMDRLIEIEDKIPRKSASVIRITTTENQLAVKLAKKIKETFKKAEVKITYSPSPSDVVYITIEFLSL